MTRTVQQYAAMSCGGEYIDNLLDGFIGAVVCGFELAIWTVVRIRAVVEAAVGDRSAAMSCGGEYIDNLLDGFIGAVVCGFELAIWTVVRIRAVVEAAVGDRSAEPFMEEQK